jgi:hypothetical protein
VLRKWQSPGSLKKTGKTEKNQNKNNLILYALATTIDKFLVS